MSQELHSSPDVVLESYSKKVKAYLYCQLVPVGHFRGSVGSGLRLVGELRSMWAHVWWLWDTSGAYLAAVCGLWVTRGASGLSLVPVGHLRGSFGGGLGLVGELRSMRFTTKK